MANWKQQQLDKLHSNGKKSVQDISESKRGELSSNKTATVISQKDCKHLKVKDTVCKNCGFSVPKYGSVFDTGTVKAFIKVVFVDESKK
jgi:ribosomal protein L32